MSKIKKLPDELKEMSDNELEELISKVGEDYTLEDFLRTYNILFFVIPGYAKDTPYNINDRLKFIRSMSVSLKLDDIKTTKELDEFLKVESLNLKVFAATAPSINWKERQF